MISTCTTVSRKVYISAYMYMHATKYKLKLYIAFNGAINEVYV